MGKRPSSDGFTADVLAPHLTAMFSSVKDGQAFSSDLLTANIVMIPKPDVDHYSWTNFRPI